MSYKGWRQRQELAKKASASSSDQPRDEESHLARALLNMHDWGHITATRVQSLAQAAMEDGLKHRSVVRLAKLGSQGRYPGNCERDLQRIRAPVPLTSGIAD
eukprot:1231966-Alexandrium_andersonii.AAC.1